VSPCACVCGSAFVLACICMCVCVCVCVCVGGKSNHTSSRSPTVTACMLANVIGALVLPLHAVSVLALVSGRT